MVKGRLGKTNGLEAAMNNEARMERSLLPMSELLKLQSRKALGQLPLPFLYSVTFPPARSRADLFI